MNEVVECGDCRFWQFTEQTKDGKFGACRRNPPARFAGDAMGVWPTVHEGEGGCGEYKKGARTGGGEPPGGGQTPALREATVTPLRRAA